MSLFRPFGRKQKRSGVNRSRPSKKHLALECLEARALVTADLLTGVPLALYSSGDSTSADTGLFASDVVPQRPLADVTPIVAYSLLFSSDPAGNNLITSVYAGQKFYLNVYVQDLRAPFANAGIQSATLNVLYDNADLIAPTGEVIPGSAYPAPSSAHIGAVSPGIIPTLTGKEAFNTPSVPFLPLGTTPQLLDTVPINAISGGTVTFTPQTVSNGNGAQVSILDDGNGNFAQVAVDQVATPVPTSITILDAPTVSIADASATTGASGTTMNFTVSVGPGQTQNQPIKIDYQAHSIGGDTAAAGTDYTGPLTGSVTIQANQPSTNISIPIAAHAQYQGDTTFHVDISVNSASVVPATLGTSQAQGTIHYTPPGLSIQNGSVTATANGTSTMSFNVSLVGSTSLPVTVQYQAVSQGSDAAVGGSDASVAGVDYFAADSTSGNPLAPPLVITPGQSSGTITIPIGAELAGPPKTFHLLVLPSTTGATVSQGLSAVGTISTTTPMASVGDASVLAPNGSPNSTTMQFPVTLTAPASQPITIDYSTTDGTAVGGGGENYGVVVGGHVTIGIGETTAMLPVTILGTDEFSLSRNFQVTISIDPNSASLATVKNGGDKATGTINYNHAAPTLQANVVSKIVQTSEVSAVAFTVLLTDGQGRNVSSAEDTTVQYKVVSLQGDNGVGGTDVHSANVDFYTGTSAPGDPNLPTLVIPAGALSGTIVVPIGAQPPLGPDKTFHLVLLSASNAQLPANPNVLATIQNAVPEVPTVSVGNASVDIATTSVINFPVTLSSAIDHDITIDYNTFLLAGTDNAASPKDFTAVSGGHIVIPAHSQTVNIPIAITSSPLYAHNKTFHINIGVDANSTGLATPATVTAVGTLKTTVEQPVVNVAPAQVTVTDSTLGNVQFTVTLTDASGNPVASGEDTTINYTSSAHTGDTGVGGTDFLAADSTQGDNRAPPLVIKAGQTSGVISILVQAPAAGPNKTFHIDLSTATGGAALGTTTTALGTIINNTPLPTAAIQSAQLVAPQSGTQNMVFAVHLTGQSSLPVTFNYVIIGTGAEAGKDYTVPTTTQVTFAAFATDATISIPILANPNLATSKSFVVTLSALPDGASNATVATAQATGTILSSLGSFSGFAYVDTNNDGIKGSSETALPGMTILLTGTSTLGQSITMTQVTGADGSYNFTNLPPGTWTITQTTHLSQYIPGILSPGAGVNVAGSQFTLTLAPGQSASGDNFAQRGLTPQAITKKLWVH